MAREPESTLLRQSDVAIVLPKAPEACSVGLAPTTSTTMTLALGDALAVALMEPALHPGGLRGLHPGGRLGARLAKVADLMHAGEEMPLTSLGTPMGEELIEMSRKGFGVVGVVDGAGALAGIVTDGDLRRHMAGLLERTVDEVMTPNPQTIATTALASEAPGVMNARKITSLCDGAEAAWAAGGDPARPRLPARRRRLSDGGRAEPPHSRVVGVLVGLPLVALGMLPRLPRADRRPAWRRPRLLAGDVEALGEGLRIANPTFTGTTRGQDTFRFTADLVVPDAAPPKRALITKLAGSSSSTAGRSSGSRRTRRPARADRAARPGRERPHPHVGRLPHGRGAGDARPPAGSSSRGRRGDDRPLGRIDLGSLTINPAAESGEARRFSSETACDWYTIRRTASRDDECACAGSGDPR